MAAKDSIVAFKPGDPVRNDNPASIHHGTSGLFQRTHDKWTFAAGLACDVLVDGESVLMSVGDLEIVEGEVK